MIPLCPVISSASTMIFVNLSGSGIGCKYRQKMTKKSAATNYYLSASQSVTR
jgi:hypothetical protein